MIKTHWFQNLTEGMDQSSNPSMTAGSPHLQNISQDRPGVWATRKGSEIVGASIGTNPGYGLFTYLANDGTRKLGAVTDRDLFFYDESGETWGSAVDTDEWTASKRVDGINFLNRLYLGCEDGTTPLAYTTGGAITDVTPTIGGSIFAVNKNSLLVCGNNIKPNIGFYSDPYTDTFHSATGTCEANADVAGANTVTATTSIFLPDMIGAVLYNTTDGEMNIITGWTNDTVVTTDTDTSGWNDDTVYVLQNNFKADNAITGAISYQEQFLVWDENQMYRFDPLSNWSSDIENAGCVNYRTVGIVEGIALWVNREGVKLWGGEGRPQDITPKIKDRVGDLGLWDLVNPSNWDSMCAGVDTLDGKYSLSVGTLQTVTGATASAIADVVFVFDIKKNAWTFRNYQDRILAITSFVDTNGDKGLYAIHNDDSFVTKLNSGATDDNASGVGQDISVDFRTPHHQLGDPTTDNSIRNYFIRYTANAEVDVSVSINRGSYASIGTLASSSSILAKEIKPLANQFGYSFSLKFTCTGDLKIEGYGFTVEEGKTLRNSSK